MKLRVKSRVNGGVESGREWSVGAEVEVEGLRVSWRG